MRLKWPSRHKENYPFLVTCSFLWVTKIAINFPLGKHFSWPITCEWKTEGKLGLRYHISKEKLKEVILGQIFTLTSFLNNLLNFLRVILENAIGSTDKYKQQGNVLKTSSVHHHHHHCSGRSWCCWWLIRSAVSGSVGGRRR